MISIAHLQEEQLAQVSALQRGLFGASAVPESVYLDWYRATPRAFIGIQNSDHPESLQGQVVILPLRASSFEKFISGSLDEHKLNPDDFALEAREDVHALYLESIVIQPSIRPLVRQRPVSLLRECISISFSVDPKIALIALAATDAGSRFMVRNGFQQCLEASATSGGEALPLFQTTVGSLA